MSKSYFYGLHFVGDDKTPIQVRVSTRYQQIWARSCPNGQWTAWRRLDVNRKPDGTLDEQVAEATHAKRADTAGRLSAAMTIMFGGDVSGSVTFDGSADVLCSLSIVALADIRARLEKLEKAGSENGNDSGGGGYY